jgi:predicted membrane-bound spermidine synthase
MKLLAYIIVFLEGGALLSYEIMVAKMYTPHVGATLYVWTSILTLTLISLAISYRLSQYLVEKNKWNFLPLPLLISGLYILGVVFTRNEILPITYTMELKSASLFTGFILLFFPVLGMGLTSPMISAWLTSRENNQHSGNFAGTVYGIGTLSGVICTLCCMFILMPAVGVNMTILLLALMLFLASVLSFYFIKKTT